MSWTAAIVAGGAASRLGSRDKSALLVAGRSILDWQLAAIRPLTEHVLVVANRPDRFRASGLPVFEDLIPGAGALGGVYTALASAGTDRVITVACDMPFVTTPFLERLARLGEAAALVIPRSPDGYQPLCACYSQACAGAIRQRIASGALRLQDLVADVRTREIGPDELAEFDTDGLLFFNVNTPADYDRAQRIAAQRAGQQQS